MTVDKYCDKYCATADVSILSCSEKSETVQLNARPVSNFKRGVWLNGLNV